MWRSKPTWQPIEHGNPTNDVDFLVDHEGHQEALMEEMTLKASTLLYEGVSTNMLSAMLLWLNLKVVHGISNAFMDELFSLLWKQLLPNENKMPTTIHEASKMVKALGLSYDSTHASPNGCVLFGGTLAHEWMCLKCNNNWFVDRSQNIPKKAFQHFSSIPRLVWMYRCKTLVELLIWHKSGTSTNGLVQNVPNSIS